MSEEAREITVQDALTQLAMLEDQLSQLQSIIAELSRRIAALAEAEEALELLSSSEKSEALVPLDEHRTIFVPAVVPRADEVLVHLGLDVYAFLPVNRATELVREYRMQLSRALDYYQRQFAALLNYYNSLRAAVEQAMRTQGRTVQG